jgi:hypothetical protein
MEGIYDVLRALLDGGLKTGGLTEEVHKAAHAIINKLDPVYQEALHVAETTLSDEEQRLLADLQAKQQRAAEAAQAPAPVATPGAGFHQEPTP